MALSNFSWLIPGQLAGSDIPGHGSNEINCIYDDIRELSSYGIKHLISLHSLPMPIDDICKEMGIEWKYFPIPDFSIPMDQMKFSVLVNAIVDKLKQNESVCIHCLAGIGRTGMVLSCVVGRWFTLDGKKAIDAVRRARNAIETDEQSKFVISFLGEYEH